VKSGIEIYNLVERFASGCVGEIVKTQTTFVEIVVEIDSRGGDSRNNIRIHYSGKREFSLNKGKFTSMQIFHDHPILIDHIDQSACVSMASGVANKEKFRKVLETAAKDVFGGWRSFESYLNMPLDIFLEKDYGILMFAPLTYAKAVVEMAEAMGVKLILTEGQEQTGRPHVIFFDEWYVIADDFRVHYLC
jgi:hypothetical protein